MPNNRENSFYENFVDIYDFFDVLLKLFRDEGVINDEFDPKNHSPEKLVLVEEYPDELANSDYTYVIYSLGERSFWNERAKTTVAPKTIQRAPRSLNTGYDLVENNIIEDKAYIYDNTIKLEVVSKSLKRIMQVAQLVESMMLKHKGRLKLYVQDVVYVGQTPTEYVSASLERRLFSRSLVFRVITYGQYSLLTEEIKYINKSL